LAPHTPVTPSHSSTIAWPLEAGEELSTVIEPGLAHETPKTTRDMGEVEGARLTLQQKRVEAVALPPGDVTVEPRYVMSQGLVALASSGAGEGLTVNAVTKDSESTKPNERPVARCSSVSVPTEAYWS
jgi:hypothetical protein